MSSFRKTGSFPPAPAPRALARIAARETLDARKRFTRWHGGHILWPDGRGSFTRSLSAPTSCLLSCAPVYWRMPDHHPVTLPDLAPAVVGFAGGRELPHSAISFVSAIVGSVLRYRFRVTVGCAIGTDEAVISALLAHGAMSRAEIFAAFDTDNNGAVATSSSLVHVAAGAGCAVHWLAGGAVQIPPRARLIRRTTAVVQSGIVALVAIWTRPDSHGTARACEIAAERDIPVVAFATFGAAPRPTGPGRWISVGGQHPLWQRAWRWQPDPPLLTLD